MMFNHHFIIRKIAPACLFLLVSWALLHLWLMLIHRVGERVASTLISSPAIYICIGVTAVLLIMQAQGGAAQEWYKLLSGLFGVFIFLISLFSLLGSALPDIEDLVFYYECFLILFFAGSPLYLLMHWL
ncbi:transporter [Cronobacter muytjensii]|nr:transporter [Cronobacter muytjensii]